MDERFLLVNRQYTDFAVSVRGASRREAMPLGLSPSSPQTSMLQNSAGYANAFVILAIAFIIFVFAIIDLAMPGLGYANAFVILAMPTAGFSTRRYANANAFVISGYAFVISGFAIAISGYAIAISGYAIVISGYAIAISGYAIVISGYAIVISGFAIVISGFAFVISGFAFVNFVITVADYTYSQTTN